MALKSSNAFDGQIAPAAESPRQDQGAATAGTLHLGVPGKWAMLRRFVMDHGAWVASLFLVGLGAKYWLLFHYGTALPYWDAWEAEAKHLYLPYFEGNFSWADLFRAHNEHRMFFSRLYCLGLLLMNGQWDNQLQTVLNAVIHSATLAGLGWALARLMGKQVWPMIWPPLALALGLPFAWENTFGGGLYTQFYFLLVFSLVMLWFMCLRPPLSTGWWLGVAAGSAALFTAGSGFLAAAAVGALTLLMLLKEPREWRRQIPTLLVCGLLGVAGLLLKVDVPRHHILQAHSPMQFVHALGRNLAWPCTDQPWCALLNLFPLVLLGWLYFRSSERLRSVEQMILGLGLWVVLQSAATAYARGAEFTVGTEGSPPASRYMDSSSFIMIADGFCIVLLTTRYRQRLWHPPMWFAGFLIWGIVCVAGLWATTDSVLEDTLQLWPKSRDTRIQTTRAFVATDDARLILNTPPYYQLAEDPEQLVRSLRQPAIRQILPACVREPLKVVPKATADTAFVSNGCPMTAEVPSWEKCWGSCSATGAGARGNFESLPMGESSLPFMAIPVAGDLGAAGLSLELVDLVSGNSTSVRPGGMLGAGWRDVYVRAPAHEFKIVATDQSETGCFAFKEPREVGLLSYWAMRLVGSWKFLLLAGLGCLLVNGMGIRRRFNGHKRAQRSQ